MSVKNKKKYKRIVKRHTANRKSTVVRPLIKFKPMDGYTVDDLFKEILPKHHYDANILSEIQDPNVMNEITNMSFYSGNDKISEECSIRPWLRLNK